MAALLTKVGFSKWVIPRKDLVEVKGKGRLQTFFLHVTSGSRSSLEPERLHSLDVPVDHYTSKIARLVEWNAEVLSGLLRSIVARREVTPKKQSAPTVTQFVLSKGGEMVLDEVAEIIALPEFNTSTFKKQVDADSIQLDTVVVDQLSHLITQIASMYR